MVESSGGSRGGYAARPLLAVLCLLALTALLAEPRFAVRGFAEGLVLAVTLLVVALILGMIFGRRTTDATSEASTAGVLNEPRPSGRTEAMLETDEGVDLSGLDLPLV
ncbi:MAG: hypothetical protein QF839_02260 [Candidatus Poseidoniaceae archaeon]|nr:hypothetical protein [Candidatus Poseidoniaceae archaeon]